jgi:hypothetical protein
MKVDGATSVYKGHMVPVGNHDGTPSWDGFHLGAKLGGLYAKAAKDEQEQSGE